MPLRCTGNRSYRLPASCLLNVSYGKRWEQSMQQQDGRQHQQKVKHHSQQKSYSQALFTNEQQSTGSGRKTGSDYSYDSKRSGEYRRGREANYEKKSAKTGFSREGKPTSQGIYNVHVFLRRVHTCTLQYMCTCTCILLCAWIWIYMQHNALTLYNNVVIAQLILLLQATSLI